MDYNVNVIKVILFDADGVILVGRKFSEYLEINFKLSKNFKSIFFGSIFKEVLMGRKDLKEVLSLYIKDWGWDKSVDKFLELWFTSEDVVNKRLISYVQVLRQKSIKCCIATNQEKYRVNYMREKMSFSNLFDKIYYSASLGHVKPDSRFFKKILNDLKGFKSGEILYWDDSSEYVKAARKLGINSEVYTTFEDFLKKMTDYGF